jgi:class 3 adenylate cyclase
MREAMRHLNAERGREDLLLKIGVHEGPCLAVTLNDRQDYFGQTVNIASRVQNLAVSPAIFATGEVVDDPNASSLLKESGVAPVPQQTALRGIDRHVQVYELP